MDFLFSLFISIVTFAANVGVIKYDYKPLNIVENTQNASPSADIVVRTTEMITPIVTKTITPTRVPTRIPTPKATSTVSPSVTPTPQQNQQPSQNNNSQPLPQNGPMVDNQLPELTSISSNQLKFGDTFSLSGSHFGTTPGMVIFISSETGEITAGAPVTSWSPTSITATVPWGASGKTYHVKVRRSDNWTTTQSMSLLITANQPRIDSISSPLTIGQPITLTGKEFGTDSGTVVFLNGMTVMGNCTISSWSQEQIVCTIGTSLTPQTEYGIQVVTKDGRSSSLKYKTLQ